MVTHNEAIEKALETWVVANDMFEDYERKAMEAAIRAYLDARGLVMVPRAPDVGMIGAWYRYKNGHRFAGEEPARDTSDVGAYSAMLAAAPDPFKEASE